MLNKSFVSLDNRLEFCIAFLLSILAFTFPIAHTATIKAICIILSLTLWIIKMKIQRKWLIQKTSVDLLIILYLFFGILSLISTVDLTITLKTIKKEMILNFLLFYLIVSNLRNSSHYKLILFAILFGNIIMIFYGLYDFFLVQKGDIFSPWIRFHSLSSDFAFFSAYSITIFPFAFIALFYMKDKKYKIPVFLIFVFNLVALYLNHQRGAWIAAIFEYFLALFILKKWRSFVILILLLITFLYLSPSNIFLHGENLMLKSDKINIKEVEGTITPRLYTWEFAIDRIKESPFLGYGLGRENFSKKYPQIKEKFGPALFHSHNLFLDITLQIGLGGLLAFLLLVLKILEIHWGIFRRSESLLTKYILLSIMIATFGFLIRNFFDNLFVSDSASFIWFLWGVGLSQSFSKKLMHND